MEEVREAAYQRPSQLPIVTNALPMLKCCLQYLLLHLRNLEADNFDQPDLLDLFSWPENERVFADYAKLDEILSPRSPEHHSPSFLHYICGLWLQTTLRNLIYRPSEETSWKHYWKPGFGNVQTSCRNEPLFRTPPVDLNQRDIHRRTLLHYAARTGGNQTVQLLLNLDSIDPNPRDSWDDTPLTYALDMRENEGLRQKDLIEPQKCIGPKNTQMSDISPSGPEWSPKGPTCHSSSFTQRLTVEELLRSCRVDLNML